MKPIATKHNFVLDGRLPPVAIDETRDLSIRMDSRMKLCSVIKQIIKAMQALGQIKRTFKYISYSTISFLLSIAIQLAMMLQ